MFHEHIFTSGGSLYMVLCVYLSVCVSTELKTTFEHCLLIKIVHFLLGDPTPVLTLSVCLFYKFFGHGLGSKL